MAFRAIRQPLTPLGNSNNFRSTAFKSLKRSQAQSPSVDSEDEVFFGTVSLIEQKRMKRLRQRRRTRLKISGDFSPIRQKLEEQAALRIQACIRRWLQEQRYSNMRRAATTIQHYWRHYRSRKLLCSRLLQMNAILTRRNNKAASCIQRWYRVCRERKAAVEARTQELEAKLKAVQARRIALQEKIAARKQARSQGKRAAGGTTMSPSTKKALLAEQQLRKETQANTLSNGEYSVTLVYESRGQLSFEQMSMLQESEFEDDDYGEHHQKLKFMDEIDYLVYDEEASVQTLASNAVSPLGNQLRPLLRPQPKDYALTTQDLEKTILIHESVESQRRGSSVVVPAQQLLAAAKSGRSSRRQSF
eukprot:TRINITY_DN17650_c0_g1_i1.p1 TRINITY_DN17650_c0_g1~~TRINITY_DN17650_c0_g1_i1.p1  ORF type:complete len:373 (+),score=55.21 TRINITY_DN17650_c0_g1_i1:37-1119(+)